MSDSNTTDTGEPYDLQRFMDAQDRGGAYADAVAELRSGRKRSHWMWFVFPQLRGLGSSPMAVRYGITSLAEARAYLAHPVLGPRLVECAELVADSVDSAERMLGSIDAMKLRSSVTLFAGADPATAAFQRVLDRHFDGVPDTRTLERL
jgi:uncharacterized protein (DUF1810 family)